MSSIEQALATVDNRTEILKACLIYGGAGEGSVPEDFLEQADLLNQNDDALLALHALANVHREAPPEIADTPEWQDYRDGHEAEAFMTDTWCTVIAELMPEHAAWKWVSQADRYLETARRVRDQLLPKIAEDRPEHSMLLALAVQAGMAEHLERFGEVPEGDFGLTILTAVQQFQSQRA